MFLREEDASHSHCNRHRLGRSCNLMLGRMMRPRGLALLLVAAVALLLAPAALGLVPQQQQLTGDDAGSSGGGGGGGHPLASVQHQEILVQPNSQVRIECKMPRMTSSHLRSYYWNFQRTAIGAAKPHLLCFESKCVDEITFGIQLEMDRETGAYDLLINNVTYENNEGLYYCHYQDSTPETKETIDREFRLTVLIPPQPPTIVPATQAPAREGQEFQLNCLTHGGNPEPNITWFRNEQALLPLGQSPGFRIEQARVNGSTTSALSWVPTIDDHQAIYKCVVWNKAMSSMQAFEREFRLQVEYAPRLSVGPYNPLKVLQGSSATLVCQVDANPPVKGIRWFKDGHLISNQFNHSLNDLRISDASVYSCQADNGITSPLMVAGGVASGSPSGGAGFLSLFGLGGAQSAAGANNNDLHHSKSPTAVEAQLHLQVLYPPRVQVRLSKSQPLSEGDFLTLNCSAEAWPPAHEFIWTKQDDPSFRRVASAAQSGSFLDFQAVSANDQGNYTCTASNRMEPSGYQAQLEQASGSAVVQVRHKPGMAEISLGQSGETELGAKTLIQCRAKPPGYPEPQYKFWKYQGASQQQKLHLNKQAHGPVYTIYSAKSDDEAKYSCMAFNEMGASTEAEGELIVNEAPEIIADVSARRPEDARAPGDFPYHITVRASGKPEPKVSWTHRSPVDGRPVDLSAPEMQARFKIETVSKPEREHHQSNNNNNNQARGSKYNVVSTLSFKTPLEVDDRGLYRVEFSNGLSRSAKEDFQLHINHAPIPAPRNQPIVAPTAGSLQQQQLAPSSQAQNSRTKAGFDLGETVNLTCRVSAYPKPQFVWYNGESDKPIENNSRYKAHLANPRDDIWESTLTFSQAQESDYGDYMCVTANHDEQANRLSDSVVSVVNLSRKTVPDAPAHLEAVESTPDSLTLKWVPGFDGGFPLNQYLVQYALDDGSGQSLSKRFPNADSQQQQQQAAGVVMASSGNAGQQGYQQSAPLPSNALDADLEGYNQQQGQQQQPKLHDCLSMNPCTIQHLHARQAYVFRLRAKNERGFSEFSDELRATTRANISQIPRILDASFDTSRNILHFRIESGSDYLLNNLNARIEARSLVQPAQQQQGSASAASEQQAGDGTSVQEISSPPAASTQQQQATAAAAAATTTADQWRLHSTVPIWQEKAEAYLNMQSDTEQLRITLCSRSNEQLCGPEYVVSLKSAASSFLQDQRAPSLAIMLSTLALIVLLGAFATSVHSCCLARRRANKKAEAIGRVEGNIDNKPIANGGANGGSMANGGGHQHHLQKSSLGSTTSTNSTSATTTNGGAGGANGGGQSMDSINGGLNGGPGSASDHSSDHSRQAKLDSMLPPNYNHYADRASIMMEQQQLMQQQQGLMTADKLASPFCLPNGALLSVASQQQQQQQMPSPMMNGSMNYFTYSQAGQLVEAQPMSLSDHHHHQASMMDGGASGLMLSSAGLGDPMSAASVAADGQHQQQMWNPIGQQLLDHDTYNNYNALGYATAQPQQQQEQEQMIDPPYGTTGGAGLIMSQQSAAYENSANSGQFHHYLGAYQQQQQQQQQQPDQAQQYQQQQQQRAQYQQDLAAAQQQMYGTLTRNHGYQEQQGKPAVDVAQQQQQQHYSTTNGLVQPLPPPPQVPQESDYGTTGGRSGRLIREIIV